MFTSAKVEHPKEYQFLRLGLTMLSGHFQQLSGKTKRLSWNKKRKAVKNLPFSIFILLFSPSLSSNVLIEVKVDNSDQQARGVVNLKAEDF